MEQMRREKSLKILFSTGWNKRMSEWKKIPDMKADKLHGIFGKLSHDFPVPFSSGMGKVIISDLQMKYIT
jgi:hypothetical protein